MAHGQGADRARTDPYKGNLRLPGPEDLPRCGITPSRKRRETRRPSDALEGWTGLEPATTALQAVALPLRYHPMCPASAGREKRKERNHFPARADRVVGQARIELTVSVFSKRMGDHTPLPHVAGLSRQSPPAWQSFAVSFRTSTLAPAGVAGRCEAVHKYGALSVPCCTSVWCG